MTARRAFQPAEHCISVDENEIRRTALSLTAGSAGGVRPQHIRDMLMCREAGADFLCALTESRPSGSLS